MADSEHGEVHVYPSELEENHGGKIPLFLKLTYIGFTTFGILYWVLYYAGDAEQWPLVKLLNAATGHG